jgi:hypothetical protein
MLLYENEFKTPFLYSPFFTLSQAIGTQKPITQCIKLQHMWLYTASKISANLNGRFHASKYNKHHTKFVTSSNKMSLTRKSKRVNMKKSTTNSAATNPASEVLIADATTGASNAMVATTAGDVLIVDGASASNPMATTAATYVLVTRRECHCRDQCNSGHGCR